MVHVYTVYGKPNLNTLAHYTNDQLFSLLHFEYYTSIRSAHIISFYRGKIASIISMVATLASGERCAYTLCAYVIV